MATTESTIDTLAEHRGVQSLLAAVEVAGAVGLAASFTFIYALGIVVVNEVFANAGVALTLLEREALAIPLGVPPAVVLGLTAAYTTDIAAEPFNAPDAKIGYERAVLLPAGVWLLAKSVHVALLAQGVL